MPRFIQKADALRMLESGGTLRYNFYKRFATIQSIVGNTRFVSYATYHALVSGDYNLRLDQRIDGGLTLILEWKMRLIDKAEPNSLSTQKRKHVMAGGNINEFSPAAARCSADSPHGPHTFGWGPIQYCEGQKEYKIKENKK